MTLYVLQVAQFIKYIGYAWFTPGRINDDYRFVVRGKSHRANHKRNTELTIIVSYHFDITTTGRASHSVKLFASIGQRTCVTRTS
tara:strand:- start:2182 stop:2436 length:255 start_codon:yes stop_codon:yes gene_type:complete